MTNQEQAQVDMIVDDLKSSLSIEQLDNLQFQLGVHLQEVDKSKQQEIQETLDLVNQKLGLYDD